MSNLEKILSQYDSLYLIDLSWVMHRSYNAFNNFFVDIDGYKQPTGHIYGTIRSIQYMEADDPNSCIIVCQDGHPVERNRIMNEEGLDYKEGRPERQYNFYQDVNKLKAILCTIPNVYWAYNEDKESDDQMYALAKQAESIELFTGSIYIYSGDNDLLQTIDDRISIIRTHNRGHYEPITNENLTIDEQFVKKFHGVDSYHIVDFRVITGDQSDHIPGIPRFPRDIAYKIAMDKDFKPETDKEIKWYKIYQDSKDIIDRNYRLMKLTSDYDVNLTKPVVKHEQLINLLDKLQLRSCKKWLQENKYI